MQQRLQMPSRANPAAVSVLARRSEIHSIPVESDHDLRFMIPVQVEGAGGYLYVLSSRILLI